MAASISSSMEDDRLIITITGRIDGSRGWGKVAERKLTEKQWNHSTKVNNRSACHTII